MVSAQPIEREVELQNIDSEVTKNAEVPAFRILANQFADFVFAQAARFRDAWNLKLGIARADVGLASAAERRHGISGNVLLCIQAVLFPIGIDAILDCVIQLLRSGSQIAAARIRGVVSVARS